jgi:hypothetical protein
VEEAVPSWSVIIGDFIARLPFASKFINSQSVSDVRAAKRKGENGLRRLTGARQRRISLGTPHGSRQNDRIELRGSSGEAELAG